jgi:Fic family protein
MNNQIINFLVQKKEPFYTEFKNMITYHSSKIEGSTLSLKDNRKLIEAPNTYKSFLEMHQAKFVIENLYLLKLFDWVIKTYKQPLTHQYIQKMHEILCQDSPDLIDRKEQAGQYRNHDVRIGNLPGARPTFIYALMNTLINENNKVLSLNEIARFHAEYEIIHPFYDGNGRTGRMIMLKQCLQNNIIPGIITDETKNNYIAGLNVFTTTNNVDLLEQYFKQCQNLTISIFKRYGN